MVTKLQKKVSEIERSRDRETEKEKERESYFSKVQFNKHNVHPISAGGLSLQPNFQKRVRGLDRVSIFRGGLLGKKRVTFFFWGGGGGVCTF